MGFQKIIRDSDSQALLNLDADALLAYRRARESRQKLDAAYIDINTLQATVRALEARIRALEEGRTQ